MTANVPNSAAAHPKDALLALQSAIDSDDAIVGGEDPTALATLNLEFHAFYLPETPAERECVDNIVYASWLNRRYRRIETQLYNLKLYLIPQPDPQTSLGQVFIDNSADLTRLQRRLESADRLFHRNLDKLDRLRGKRPPTPPPARPLAAVPPQPKPVDPAPPPSPPQAAPAPPAPPQTTPQPVEPEDPRPIFGPWLQARQNPHHPPIQQCRSCLDMGYIHPRCMFIPRKR